MDESGSVAATPGRQYFAEGLVQLYVFYTYSDIVYDCGEYCDGYWYDAEGYSLLSTSQPSNANWPSIEYSYPYLDEPEPVASQSLAMMGSGATAWAPPVIYSVNGVAPPGEAQLPVGAPTPVTIVGVGFGYSPTLTINGNGVTGYTNPCASSPSSSCDSTIMATVTIDANTPTNSQETITVMAGGQNPSGWLPVDTGYDQNQQVTAQATVIPAPKPTIVWGQGQSACQSATQVPATVVVGQQIAFTGCLPSGAQASSETWSPTAADSTKAVAGWFPSLAKADAPKPVSATSCGTDAWCGFAPFYFIVPGTYTFSFSYTPSNSQTPVSTSMTLTVAAPTNLNVDVPMEAVTISNDSQPTRVGPYIAFGTSDTGPGITFTANPTSPQGGSGVINGIYSWVQLITADQKTYRLSVSGVQYCTNAAFGPDPTTQVVDTTPALDTSYPYATGISTLDAPALKLTPTQGTQNVGEMKNAVSFAMYFMWDPGLQNSILVPLGTVTWQYGCDAINTLTPQPAPNGTNWTAACASPLTPGKGTFVPGTSFPKWTRPISTSPVLYCHF